MALSPLALAGITPAPMAAAVAAATTQAAEPAVQVTPTVATLDNGAAGHSTSEQQAQSYPGQPRQTQPGIIDPMARALDEINSQLKAWSTELHFEVDKDAHRVVVSIIDVESGDVIRTVPNETVIRIAKMIVKLQGQAVETTA